MIEKFDLPRKGRNPKSRKEAARLLQSYLWNKDIVVFPKKYKDEIVSLMKEMRYPPKAKVIFK